jgi:hypothetical protein
MNDTRAADRSIRYDALSELTVENERHALHTAVSDMLALEQRIKAPIAQQLVTHESSTSADAARAIARIDIMTDVHVRGLEEQLQRFGDRTDRPAKPVAPHTRRPKLSASLRDDYAALSLAAIGYTMLRSTALGFGDAPAATLAKQHLDDVASVIAEIGRIMPAVVLQELLDDGLDISAEVRQRALRNTHENWRSTP